MNHVRPAALRPRAPARAAPAPHRQPPRPRPPETHAASRRAPGRAARCRKRGTGSSSVLHALLELDVRCPSRAGARRRRRCGPGSTAPPRLPARCRRRAPAPRRSGTRAGAPCCPPKRQPRAVVALDPQLNAEGGAEIRAPASSGVGAWPSRARGNRSMPASGPRIGTPAEGSTGARHAKTLSCPSRSRPARSSRRR